MKKFNFCLNHFIYICKIKNIAEMYNYNEKKFGEKKI